MDLRNVRKIEANRVRETFNKTLYFCFKTFTLYHIRLKFVYAR